MENVVYNHLVFRGYKVKVGAFGDKKIDFITQKDGEKIYIQVALSIQDEKTITREFVNLMGIKDNYPKMEVSLDVFTGVSYQGIKVIDLRSFLLAV